MEFNQFLKIIRFLFIFWIYAVFFDKEEEKKNDIKNDKKEDKEKDDQKKKKE